MGVDGDWRGSQELAQTAQVVPLVRARALDRAFDYLVPEDLGPVAIGSLVACPLGRRAILGIVVGRDGATHEGKLAALAGVVAAPPISPELMDLAVWIARYYAAPLAACLRLVLRPGADGTLRRGADGSFRLAEPPGAGRRRLVARRLPEMSVASGRRAGIVRVLADGGGTLPAAELIRAAKTTMATLRRMADEGTISLTTEESGADANDWLGEGPPTRSVPPTLSPDQATALATIAAEPAGRFLLHGVTGSGKTEVYLRAIELARAEGRGSLLLVPEIALTPQTAGRLRARLGERVAIWHSGLSAGERVAEDRRIRDGRADVVVGARSAVFAPVLNLGLVIVDEEHDASYKQDQSPRYDARQVAYRRAAAAGARLLYGTATPRPESWKALTHLTLRSRPDGAPLPKVEVVDMRVQRAGPISRPLEWALQDAAARGEKAIVLLNRRGFSRMALCAGCGWIARCPDCDVALVLHRPDDGLVCHHCGFERGFPDLCPGCGAAGVMRQGTGTQGLEEALAAVVPGVPLVRLDADRAAGRGSIARILAEFARPGAAILLGTQMVAKGHDLPGVAVAAVIDADGPLQYPDFRAEERAFSLIVQLAGRAGRRAGEHSTVIVQAWEPAARAVQLAANHDVQGFLEGEIERRTRRGFPPFGHLVRVVVDGDVAADVAAAASTVAERLKEAAPDLMVLGPARLHRLRARERRAILIRADRAVQAVDPLRNIVADLAPELRRLEMRLVLDVDPQDT